MKTLVDFKGSVSVISEEMTFEGNCNCEIIIKEKGVNLSVKDNSKLVVYATGFSVVSIDLYDNAEVFIDSFEFARVMIFRHSPNTKVTKKQIGKNKIKDVKSSFFRG